MAAQVLAQSAILVVDDQDNDLELIKRAFQKAALDYSVQTVKNGMDAMAYLSGTPPFTDRSKHPLPIMVLLDIRMPMVDGFEVLRWIRRNLETTNLPVAMLTGAEAIHDATTAYQLGATTFFVKPFDFTNALELARTVSRIITKGRESPREGKVQA